MFPRAIGKFDNMRKPQEFVVLTTDGDDLIVQSDKRFGRFNFRTGEGRLSTKGNSTIDLHPIRGGIDFTFPPEFVTACLEAAAPKDAEVSLAGGGFIIQTTVKDIGGPA